MVGRHTQSGRHPQQGVTHHFKLIRSVFRVLDGGGISRWSSHFGLNGILSKLAGFLAVVTETVGQKTVTVARYKLADQTGPYQLRDRKRSVATLASTGLRIGVGGLRAASPPLDSKHQWDERLVRAENSGDGFSTRD